MNFFRRSLLRSVGMKPSATRTTKGNISPFTYSTHGSHILSILESTCKFSWSGNNALRTQTSWTHASSAFSTAIDPVATYSDDEDEESMDDNQRNPKIVSDHRTHNESTNTIHNHLDDCVADLTFARDKAGTPSPWALFDAWGADELRDESSSSLSSSSSSFTQDQTMLSEEAVRIPMTAEQRADLPEETQILEAFDQHLQQRSSVHMGYPYNLMYDHSELYSFMKYSINNLGDPFVASNYGVHSRQFEVSVVDFFAKLWKMEQDAYWGYVTTCGTEGNLHGILLARETFPDGILYTSQESHYSIFKAAKYYRMDCRSIPTLPMGEINYDMLAEEIDRNRDKPVILNVNIGTTVKGAVDNLDRIIDILKTLDIPRERFYIHCDGALFALMMPFLDDAPEISFQKPIDSIAVSGHKMLGSPMPCGIALCRKEHVENVEQHIDYLNSVDTTIMGSRNGQAALYMWYSLRKKGLGGIKRDVVHCMEAARYLRDELTSAGFACRLNYLSSTVVLERPVDDAFIKRWQLACEEDIAHVVVMPNVTHQKIDVFVKEMRNMAKMSGRTQPLHASSPLSQLSCESSWRSSSDDVTANESVSC